MTDFYDCFLIKETEKARLFHMKDSQESLWVPKSVIMEMITHPVPEGEEHKYPGTPTLLKVQPWFIGKNKDAFND